MLARRPTSSQRSSEIRTDRLSLGALGLAAVDAMWREDTETLDALTRLRWPSQAPPTLTEHLPLVRGQLEAGDDPAWWIWSIGADASREAIGAAGFSGPPDDHGLVWVGYALYAPHRGSGFATEAVRAIVEWAFTNAEVSAVLATIAPENHASRAVAGRVGLRFHRHEAPMGLYRVTRGQWGLAT